VRGLAFGYTAEPLQRDVSFNVEEGSIFAIMGTSGCGKSTLLKALIGLLRPLSGAIIVDGNDYWQLDEAQRARTGRSFGVVFQGGALWSSLTASENVALPLEMFTELDKASIDKLVSIKLSLVGLNQGRSSMPSELSGGMRHRVGLARALALATNLMARLPQNRVVWSDPGQKSTRELLVDVESFDAWPDGHCVLSATWTLTDAINGAVLGSARETFRAAPAGGETQSDVRVVAGMADVLGKLADSIALAAAARHLTRRGALEFNSTSDANPKMTLTQIVTDQPAMDLVRSTAESGNIKPLL
jgi:ABC-type ATPase involved in cell division